jgi:cellulose synthase/poly-beta-1,6-N-acetylglucosamine synthase-like glycosyltransferase
MLCCTFVRHTIMQQALLIILLFIFSLYVLLILYYWKSWISIPDFKFIHRSPAYRTGRFSEGGPQTQISVIIPARNEEENIAACLDSVCAQSYPKHLFEVLVVDDHSSDNTAKIIRSYTDKNVKLISLKDFVSDIELNSYKKKAIEIAIQQSTGELIVTTDADCVVSGEWLQNIAAFYEQFQSAFIVMPVRIRLAANSIKQNSPCGEFLRIFQTLDFMTLQGITGASVHKKVHSMCNGANLSYTKKAFEEAGGFAGIDSIASGDDMLLMHKIYKHYPDKVMFLKSKDVIVQTAPVKSIKDFFNQRIRWASKAGKYEDKRIFAVLLIVYLFNLALIAIPVFALLKNIVLEIRLYPFTFIISLLELWLFLVIIKTVIELFFLYPVAKFFGNRKMLWLFPFMQPFHIVYTVIAGWLGKFGSYKWKERKVK